MQYTQQTDITVDTSKPWTPPLFGKQWDIFNCRKRILLVSGSRNSGKTVGVLHRVIRHMWETPGASIAVIAKSKGLAKGGGSWNQLTTTIIKKWIDSGMVGQSGLPFNWTSENQNGPGPAQYSETRTPYFKIRNYWGGESECILLSVDHDGDVFEKIKTKYFSMVYFMELSMFKDPRVLSTAKQCLRMEHLKVGKDEENPWMMVIADTNPDEDEGDQSWIHKEFYQDRLKESWSSDPDPVKREKEDSDSRFHYSRMEVIEMFYHENPYLSREETIELERSCNGDPALYDSWVLGKWGEAGKKRNRLFSEVFVENVHVVGGGVGESDQIAVSPMSTNLLSGWDIGGVNHAAVALDRWPVMINGRELSGFSVLDELVYIKEQMRVGEFGAEMYGKILNIDNGGKRQWIHWSDDSALNVWRPNSGTFDYLDIRAATNGNVNLQGVQKPRESITARIRLLRKLVWQNRLYVSARCAWVIRLLKEAKAGTDDPFDESTGLKHIFDALTYPLFMECLWELEEASGPPKATRGNGVVSANL